MWYVTRPGTRHVQDAATRTTVSPDQPHEPSSLTHDTIQLRAQTSELWFIIVTMDLQLFGFISISLHYIQILS